MFPLGHKVEHEKNSLFPDGIGHPKNISALAALSLDYKPLPIAVVLILLEHFTLFHCFKIKKTNHGFLFLK